jgi:hypothetical protein
MSGCPVLQFQITVSILLFRFEAQAAGCDKPDVSRNVVPYQRARDWLRAEGSGCGAGLGVEVHDLAGDFLDVGDAV